MLSEYGIPPCSNFDWHAGETSLQNGKKFENTRLAITTCMRLLKLFSISMTNPWME